MGSYCSLYVGNIEVGSTKNAIDPSVMLLFRAADRVEATLVPGTPEYARYYRMPGPDDKWVAEVHQRVCYETSARIVRERLDLLGFSFEASSRAFEVAVERELAYVRRRALEEHGSLWKDDLERLENFNLAVWRDGMSQIVAHDLWAVDQHSSEFAALSPLLRRMLSRDYEQWMGCPVRDVRHVIGLLLSVVEADETVYYDLTDLVAGGWVDDEADLVDYSEKLLRTGAAGSERVIVLTEGSTDKFILENSLMLLFPHLLDYFRFMDFEGARVAGGAGALASTVKAFVGAGILNRVVAVFDNDTAAAEALTTLESVDLPPNYVIFQYPRSASLAAYPTLGPTGVVTADINGLAASIELYLGRDVLKGENGELTPVHWRGYNDAMERYQGVIRDKAGILDRFRNKVARCADPAVLETTDWADMRGLLVALSRAAGQTAEGDLLALEELDEDTF
jgi:hypothetical protein